jgi:hypothetical protein
MIIKPLFSRRTWLWIPILLILFVVAMYGIQWLSYERQPLPEALAA